MNLVLHPHMVGEIPTIQAEDIRGKLGQSFWIVDVRRPEEFTGELGHIPDARLVTLGPDLMRFLQTTDPAQEIVFVCRSGNRSAQATALSQDLGFSHTMNLAGGMLRWNELKLSARTEVE